MTLGFLREGMQQFLAVRLDLLLMKPVQWVRLRILSCRGRAELICGRTIWSLLLLDRATLRTQVQLTTSQTRKKTISSNASSKKRLLQYRLANQMTALVTNKLNLQTLVLAATSTWIIQITLLFANLLRRFRKIGNLLNLKVWNSVLLAVQLSVILFGLNRRWDHHLDNMTKTVIWLTLQQTWIW